MTGLEVLLAGGKERFALSEDAVPVQVDQMRRFVGRPGDGLLREVLYAG